MHFVYLLEKEEFCLLINFFILMLANKQYFEFFWWVCKHKDFLVF